MGMSHFTDQIDFLRQHSEYAKRWLLARPLWEEWLYACSGREIDLDGIRELLASACALVGKVGADEREFMAQLRLARQRLMLWLAFRDLNGFASLEEVTHALSHFAEQVIAIAIDFQRAELETRFGLPQSKSSGLEMPLMVVGMGKLGGKELNVSSDVDLIFLYEHEGDTQGGVNSLSHQEWFTRMGKRLIKFLSEYDENGFVFRVDMRLRPNGDSGPLVCSLDMLEEYLTIQGREWERYAWIKGQLIYPSQESPVFAYYEKALDQVIRPFVYRRHLDYGVISAIRDLHTQIQHEAERRSANRLNRLQDIKLGRGGIREIEFLAQMFQLMRGGTDPRFRVRPTLEVLALLKRQNLLTDAETDDLSNAYVFLRRLEHRIQIWEDQQTHYFPDDEVSRRRLAQSMVGPKDSCELNGFLEELDSHQNKVARLFEKAFVLDGAERIDLESTVSNWQLERSIFPESFARWEAWIESPKQKLLTEKNRQIFEGLLRKASEYLYDDIAHRSDLDHVLVRFFDLLEAVARRSAYLSILAEYPQALKNVLALLGASKWGAQYLTQHPYLLDHLLSSRTEVALIENPDEYWSEVKISLDVRLDDAGIDGDFAEHAMDILRITHHTETFITLLTDLGIGVDHALPVEKVSDHLSALADLILQTTLERVWPGVAERFGLSEHRIPPFAVVAYGKLGGKELGYSSDLDLVFLYGSKAEDFSEQEVYAMLAKRMINWLTSYTAAGNLFEIDTRLRPNGSAGFLVTNVDAFRKYQLREGDNTAWVWEHQALTRARFSAGCEIVGGQFDVIRSEVLGQKRNLDALRTEILEMRRKVHDGHPNSSGNFDLKHDSGGMVDIEFIVQFLVLAYAHKHTRLISNLGNIALLGIAAQEGLISHEASRGVADAYRLFRSRQHRVRLDGTEKARVCLDLETDFAFARTPVQLLWFEIFQAPSELGL